VVTEYKATSEGEPKPGLPVHCPFGGDGKRCRVGVHCRRARQCGPRYRLVVAVCHAHRQYFTLYPPGWTPWGRVPVQAVAEDGSVAWGATQFGAARDAARGVLWPVGSVGAPGCGRTQLRRIRQCAKWLGIDAGRAVTEQAAGTLELPLAELLGARSTFLGSTSRRAGGGVVAGVLEQRSWGPAELRGLLVVGARAEVCGRAWIVGHGGVSQPVVRI